MQLSTPGTHNVAFDEELLEACRVFGLFPEPDYG
jgi:hypothetical protein